ARGYLPDQTVAEACTPLVFSPNRAGPFPCSHPERFATCSASRSPALTLCLVALVLRRTCVLLESRSSACDKRRGCRPIAQGFFGFALKQGVGTASCFRQDAARVVARHGTVYHMRKKV